MIRRLCKQQQKGCLNGATWKVSSIPIVMSTYRSSAPSSSKCNPSTDHWLEKTSEAPTFWQWPSSWWAHTCLGRIEGHANMYELPVARGEQCAFVGPGRNGRHRSLSRFGTCPWRVCIELHRQLCSPNSQSLRRQSWGSSPCFHFESRARCIRNHPSTVPALSHVSLRYAMDTFPLWATADHIELISHWGNGRLSMPHTSDVSNLEAARPALCHSRRLSSMVLRLSATGAFYNAPALLNWCAVGAYCFFVTKSSSPLNPGGVCCSRKALLSLSAKSPSMHSTFEPAGATQHVGIRVPWTRAVLDLNKCGRVDRVDRGQCFRREIWWSRPRFLVNR